MDITAEDIQIAQTFMWALTTAFVASVVPSIVSVHINIDVKQRPRRRCMNDDKQDN